MVAAAGCGTTARRAATTTPTTTDVSPSPCKLTARTRAQLARARRDLATLRVVARRQTRYSELGTPAMQHASDRYLEDLIGSSLDPWRVNRMIDFGAAAVGGVCGHCFEEFENNRPIPQMKYNPHC